MSGYSAPRPISEHDVVADFDSGEPCSTHRRSHRLMLDDTENAPRYRR